MSGRSQTAQRSDRGLQREQRYEGSTAERLRGYLPDYSRELLTSPAFRRAIRWSLDRLPPKDRELLYLRYVDNLTWAATARQVGLKDRDAAQYAVEGKGTSRPGPVVRKWLKMAEQRLPVEQERGKMDRLVDAFIVMMQEERAKAA